MSTTNRNECKCWIPVLGTVLVLFSLFDMMFSFGLASFAEQLAAMSNEVEAHKTSLGFANVFTHLTGGMVHLGQSAESDIIRLLVAALPPLWWVISVSWVRVGLAIGGVVLGLAFAREKMWSIKFILLWSVVSLLWGLIAIFGSSAMYGAVLSAPSVGGAIVFLFDFGFHVLWPACLGGRVLWELRRGGFS